MKGGLEQDKDKSRGKNLTSWYATGKRHLMGSSSSAPMVKKTGFGYNGLGEYKSYRIIEEKWISTGVNGDEDSGNFEGGGGEHFYPLNNTVTDNTSGIVRRKRVRLHTKEEFESIDVSPVPRKLRSAIKKRSKQIVLSPLLNTKKKHHAASNCIEVPFEDGSMRSNNCLLSVSITEDEKEVVEALYEMSSMVALQSTEKTELKESLDLKNNNKNTLMPPKVSNRENNTHLPYDGAKVLTSSIKQPIEETANVDVLALADPLLKYETQTSMQDLNKPLRSAGYTTALLSKNANLHATNFSSNMTNHSTCLGNPHDSYSQHCAMQPNQPYALSIESAKMGCEAEVIKKYVRNSRKLVDTKGTNSITITEIPYNEADAHSPANGQLALKADCTPVMNSSRHISSGNDLQSKNKAFGVTRSWKNCVIHMYISHMIKDYQTKEKQQPMSLTSERSKSGGEIRTTESTSCETTGRPDRSINIISATADGLLTDGNLFKERNDAKLESLTKPPTVSSENYAYQKLTHDFLSLSTSTRVGTFGNSATPPGLLPSFLHPQTPHHSIVRFPFPHMPYLPASTSVATQQVRLQAPPYAGNSYVLQMDQIAATSKLQQQYQQRLQLQQLQSQQQQMWQAHLAHLRQQMGVHLVPNGQLQVPSLCANGQPSSMILPSPIINLYGGPYHHALSAQQQHMLLVGSSAPSKAKI